MNLSLLPICDYQIESMVIGESIITLDSIYFAAVPSSNITISGNITDIETGLPIDNPDISGFRGVPMMSVKMVKMLILMVMFTSDNSGYFEINNLPELAISIYRRLSSSEDDYVQEDLFIYDITDFASTRIFLY